MTGRHALWDTLYDAWSSGRTSALATVVDTFGSAPRPIGSSMLLTPAGQVVGSVSGGCVEGDVLERARESVLDGTPQRATYGISDDDAFAVGLTCGGTLEVYVEPVDRDTFPGLGEVMESVRAGVPVAVVTVLEHRGSPPAGRHAVIHADGRDDGPCPPGLPAGVLDDARALLRTGDSGLLHYASEDLSVFVRSLSPPPRMLLFGAGDFAAALASVGRTLGYEVTVCDARPLFTTADRLPDADEVVVARPDEYLAGEVARGRVDARTVVVSFTHDPKFDIPLLERALGLDVAFVGALGSRRTHERRARALAGAGVSARALARLSSPVGLDLGGRSPGETAVSIAAEIIAARHGGGGERLSLRAGPVHLRPTAVSRG
ncbi:MULTISPECIES: XdhC family protein [unclassified Streptomyces]|uniref:XdhC family protein n=1 Tax=unclassified Streptomyces TaxID=2593676 RepID=UPI000A9C17A5|nr:MULTISPECIES: XdhC/CoxI family protein [unclassified Streptomyces]AZM58283.1 XshC-Cox1 family protein [Streptomyces sp. WAC 01438]RSM88793.1 XshC-Cox1 family protein [Streptomyces sp. WAC 01420]